jgi:argininosuccinate synthase
MSAGAKSPYSLYSQEYVTFGADEVYNQADATGFITLFGLPLTVRALMKQGKLK